MVTGGAGFIGSQLSISLLDRGCQVRVLDNFATGTKDNLSQNRENPAFELVEGSILDEDVLNKALADVDVVFHLACLGVRHSLRFPFENHRVNAEGTLNVLGAARTAGVERFLYCSSSEIYGTAERVPMDENHPARPCTVYGASKLAGEAYARAFFKTWDFPTIVIRPFNTFGPRSHFEGDAGEVIPKCIVRALGGRELLVFGDGSQTRDFTYVEDTAAALIAAVECDQAIGQTLNIGSEFEISIRDLAQKIIGLVGNKSARIEYGASRPGDVGRLFADCSRFRTLTGWKAAVSFEQGMNRTIEYFRNHPAGIDALLAQEKGRSWEAKD